MNRQRALVRYAVPERYAHACFPGQFEGETALFVIRYHWIAHAENIFLAVVSFIILTTVLLLLQRITPENVRLQAVLLLIVMGAMYIVLVAFIRWIDHHLSMIIITDRRIVWTKQRHLFSRTTVEVLLGQVKDARTEVHGFLPTVLRYGEIVIETSIAKIRFNRVPRPTVIMDQVLKLIEKNKSGETPADSPIVL